MTDRFLSQSSNYYKAANSANAIRLEPSDSVRFESILPGSRYVTSFALRNTTDTSQRIRIKPPKSSYFTLNYIPGGAVAPGLEVHAEIECLIPSDAADFIFTETIIASMGPHTVNIPISALTICAKVVFENFIDMGCSANLDKELTKDILFENKGEVAGSVEFRLLDDSKMKIRPMKFELQSIGKEGSQQRVVCLCDNKDIGMRRESVQVIVTGGSGSFSSLEINAEVVRPKLSLLAEGKKGLLDTWDFGSVFFGEKKSTSGVLVNNGPQPLSYSVTYADDEKKNPQTEDNDSYEKSITISPSDGIIEPFSEKPVKISFHPEIKEQKYGFEKQFIQDVRETKIILRKVFIDCPMIDQRIILNIQGAANIPLVHLSPCVMRFGTCPVYDRRDIRATLTNKSEAVTTFLFPQSSQFKMIPPKGILQPLQSLSVIISFQPSQLGTFKSVMQISISNGLTSVDVKLHGEANPSEGKKNLVGGTDKLVQDFEKNFKFVDPSSILMYKMENENLRNTVEKDTVSLTSKDRDRMYGMNR